MGKWKMLTAVLAVILALSACAPVVPVETTTAPTETTAPPATQPVTEPAPTLVALDASKTSLECTYWKTPDEDSQAPQTMTVTFEGKTYTGTFLRTGVKIPMMNQRYYYKFDGGQFAVNLENNRIDHFTNNRYSTGDMLQEECEKIAAKIAGQYVDITEYELHTKHEGDLYAFDYRRIINGIETSDFVYIVISTGGDLFSFGLGTQDAFSSENTRTEAIQQSLEVLSSEAVETALQDKLNAIYSPAIQEKYPGAQITFRPSSEFWNEYWVMLPDGSVGLLYDGQINMLIQHGEKTAYQSDLFRILVKCE